jgi:osmotically-inducible protein OsmY
MKKAVLFVFGAACLLACAKEKPAETTGITTITRGSTNVKPPATPEHIRAVLLERRPGSADAINALVISTEDGIVTLRGQIEDEATHADLLNHVRAMPNVKGVHDELRVVPKAPAHAENRLENMEDEYGPTSTTSGTMGGEQHGKPVVVAKSVAVRKHLEEAAPRSLTIIRGLMITDDGTIVTVKGIVPDEATHQSLAKAARETPDVKGIKDELKVQKKH